MCLSLLLSKKDKRQWLKKQPDTVTVYKVVSLYGDGVCPSVFQSKGRFRRTNKMFFLWKKVEVDILKKYKPYYHLFVNKIDAEAWKNVEDVVIECTVPKNKITAVGRQHGLVIIAKEFTFVGGNEYFKEDE